MFLHMKAGDVDTIALGRDFRETVRHRLASSEIMLALVGRDWVAIKDASGGSSRALHLRHKPVASIFWSPETGAHEVFGAIREKLSELGAERSSLGYPCRVNRLTRTDVFNDSNVDHCSGHPRAVSSCIAAACMRCRSDLSEPVTGWLVTWSV